VKVTAIRFRLTMLAAGVLCSVAFAFNSRAAEGTAAKSVKPFNVKQAFVSGCSFCHEDYGRHAGKGPQLMNSAKSDAFLFKRIKYGKRGRMAGYGRALSDDQIQQMVIFIRSLKADEEPQNPQ
jgi:cytochrome c553